jgi:hypothetical protein
VTFKATAYGAAASSTPTFPASRCVRLPSRVSAAPRTSSSTWTTSSSPTSR